jgi:hypothetical protein
LPFVGTDDGIAAGEPTECFNPNAAVKRAEALSRKEGHVGAVAFSRTGDPATGDFSDASSGLMGRRAIYCEPMASKIKSEGSIVLRHSMLCSAPTWCRKVCSAG